MKRRDEVARPGSITTTLFSLIDAVSEELGEAHQDLVTPAVVQILRTGHARLRIADEEVTLSVATRPWRRAC